MNRAPLVASGLLLGAGLGGFVDGILLHQLLQWHHMLSAIRPPNDVVAIKVNMVWDGLFHAFTWIVTVIGIGLLWRAGQRSDVPWSGRTFVGAILGGWGLFNSVEGAIDHLILRIHHVRPGESELMWDLGFIASGIVLMLIGWSLARAGRGDVTPRGAFGAPLTPQTT